MIEIFQKTNIDLTSPGAVKLADISADCLVPEIFLHVVQKNITSGSSVVSIGTNAPNYDNWLPPNAIDEILLGRFRDFISEYAGKAKFSNGDAVYLKIVDACQGTFVVNAYGHGFEI